MIAMIPVQARDKLLMMNCDGCWMWFRVSVVSEARVFEL